MRSLQSFWRGLLMAVACCALAFPAYARSEELFSPEQLEQLVAPIALYPDPLLTQILMASTYPSNVAEAADWSRDHPWLRGDDAVWEVRDYDWDPSVQSLTAFPQVLAMMGGHPSWVRDLGDAFLAQPDDVMDAVQRLRFRAYNAGYLHHPRHLRVVFVTPAIIQIVLVNPGYLYVPYYDPDVVYGDWPYADYPPVYFPPPRGYGFPTVVNTGIVFGVSITITHALWGGCNWVHHDVFINVNHYNRIYINNRINVTAARTSWQHDPHFRHDVPYPTTVMRSRFQKPQPPLFRQPVQTAPRITPIPAQRPPQQAPQGLPHREEARPQAVPPVMQHRNERPNQAPPQAIPRREERPNQPPQAMPRREERPNQPPQAMPRREERPNQLPPQARPRREEQPIPPRPEAIPRREERPNQPPPQARPRREEQPNQSPPQAMPRREERPMQPRPEAMPRREERPNQPPPQTRPRREEQMPRQDQQQHKKPLPDDIERQSP